MQLENGRSTPGCLTVVCNTTVSTKKTRRTVVKSVRKLRVMPHACEENTPVSIIYIHTYTHK